tara:strand:- start:1 stop:372 length:372 start_codon:yes stop_codon:yes gene_type:complete
MVDKKAINNQASKIINLNTDVFVFNALMSRKEYKMNELLYSLLKGRLIDELKGQDNYIAFTNKKIRGTKGTFNYSCSLKEVEKTLFDIKGLKANDPNLYQSLITKYNKKSVASVIQADLKRVK